MATKARQLDLDFEEDSLEHRLNDVNQEARDEFLEQLLKPLVRPKEIVKGKRYLKDDLAHYIVERLGKDGVNFDEVNGPRNFENLLYNAINKEPLKRTYWGQGNADVPEEIISQLDPWMAVYFYTGVWIRKSTRLPHRKFFARSLENQSNYKIVRDTVIEGMRYTKESHNKMYREGKYKHPIKTVPHEKEILEMLPPPISSEHSQRTLKFA